MLAAELTQPGELVVVEEMVAEVPGHGQVTGDEAVPCAVRGAGVGELLGAELADGVEHQVLGWAWPPASGAGSILTSTDLSTSRMSVGMTWSVVGPVGAHFLGRAHGERAGEDGQARPQRPLGGGAEVMAPADRVPQRLVAAAALPACQQRQPLVKAAGELGERERAQPHGGEFDALGGCRRAAGTA